MINSLKFLSALMLSVLATACGGGGGGGFGGLTAADATVVIDTNNAIDIIRSVDDTSAIAEDLILDTVVGSASIAAASAAAVMINADSTAVTPGGSTYSCSNGDENANVTEDLTTLTLTFSSAGCQDFLYASDDLGQLDIPGLVKGALRIEVSPTSAEENFQATVTLTDFSIDDTWGDGTLTLDYMETTSLVMVEISTRALDIGQGTATRSLEAYRFLFIGDSLQETEDSRGGVTSSDFDRLAVFDTPQPFATNTGDLWPSSGSRIIYGADQAKIQVRAVSNAAARIDLDLDGDDDFEKKDCEYTWEELLGDSVIIACEGV